MKKAEFEKLELGLACLKADLTRKHTQTVKAKLEKNIMTPKLFIVLQNDYITILEQLDHIKELARKFMS